MRRSLKLLFAGLPLSMLILGCGSLRAAEAKKEEKTEEAAAEGLAGLFG